MNHKAIVSAIMAISLTSAGFAFAQGKGDRDRDDRGRDEKSQRGDRHDNRDNDKKGGPRGRGDNDGRFDNRRDDDRAHYDNHRGAGPSRAFHKGGRLPAEYRHRQYVVDDWRGHQLSQPPRGYHWVQTGGDYVLVAIATGIIAQLFLSN
jgi:Ni/Co efflux regulator RcnB